MLFIWFTIFVKVDGFENFKMGTCCTECVELGNVTFLSVVTIVMELLRVEIN